MARRQAKLLNKITMHDNISDTDITLYYRMPTTKERQEYQNSALRRKGNTVEMNQAEARLTYGMQILEGFDPGNFERLDSELNYVPISSQEGSANYYPEWKPFVEENGADLVMLMAAHVYDASATLQLGGESLEGK